MRGEVCYISVAGKNKIIAWTATTGEWTTSVAHFDPGSVVWDLASTNKYDAIREIVFRARVFSDCEGLNLNDFAERVIRREKLQSTGFGHGVAVAHGRTAQVNQPHVALGISRQGLEYEAFDGEPVRLLFVVANHPDQQMDYLQILSSLVAMVRNGLFRQEILTCRQAEDVQQKVCTAFGNLMAKAQLSACRQTA